MLHLTTKTLAFVGIIAFLLGAFYLAESHRAAAAPPPASLNNPSLPLLTVTPTPTACPLNYSISQSIGATIVPGATLVSGSQCDDCARSVSLPFAYTLYDQSFTSISVSSNGVVAFGGQDPTFFNNCLPDALVNYAIFPLWTDWTTDNTNAACDAYPGGTCGIYTSVSGSAPNRVFNIEWRAISFDHPIPVNFELQLFEGQTHFEIVYASLDPAPNHTDTATVAAQKDTGSVIDLLQCPDQPGIIAPGTRLTFDLVSACFPPSPTSTPTSTPTATGTATATPSSTPAPLTLRGHVVLQGRPAPPNSRWVTTIAGSVKPSVGGGTTYNYQATTDTSGYFTVTLPVQPGSYSWRAKDPQTLANSGSTVLLAGTNNVEMGTLREGDANNDNCVTITDFTVLRATYGKSLGDTGYDSRADFNADTTVNITDFTLLKANTGQCGASPLSPAP